MDQEINSTAPAPDMPQSDSLPPIAAEKGARIAQPAGIAVVDLGPCRIGIPVANLREVMPLFGPLQPLPGRHPAIVGCVTLRGQIIPVAEVTGLAGLATTQDPRIIVVLRLENRLLGILAQDMCRILPGQEIAQQLGPDGDALGTDAILPAVALIEGDVVALLSTPTLFATVNVACVEAQPARRANDRSHQYLLCEIGERRYCVPVSAIEATLPETEVDAQIVGGGACLGAVRRHGIEMALADPFVLVGLAWPTAPPSRSAGIVLKLDDKNLVALRADRVLDILHIQKSQISPMSPALCARADLVTGIIFGPDNDRRFVLDLAKLLLDEDLRQLAALAHPTAAAPAEAGLPPSSSAPPEKEIEAASETAVLFRAGGLWAVSITDVEEILSVPTEFIDADRARDGFCPSIRHRSMLIQIVPAAMRNPDTEDGPRVIIIVRQGQQRIGLMVDELTSIETVRFVEERSTSGSPRRIAVRARGREDRFVAMWQ